MDTIYKILFFVLLAGLLYYYYQSYQSNAASQANKTWPRKISECPDYFISNNKGGCKNTYNLGTCPSVDGVLQPNSVVKFDTSEFTGDDGDYNKCRWAKNCNVSWEGIDKLCA